MLDYGINYPEVKNKENTLNEVELNKDNIEELLSKYISTHNLTDKQAEFLHKIPVYAWKLQTPFHLSLSKKPKVRHVYYDFIAEDLKYDFNASIKKFLDNPALLKETKDNRTKYERNYKANHPYSVTTYTKQLYLYPKVFVGYEYGYGIRRAGSRWINVAVFLDERGLPEKPKYNRRVDCYSETTKATEYNEYIDMTSEHPEFKKTKGIVSSLVKKMHLDPYWLGGQRY